MDLKRSLSQRVRRATCPQRDAMRRMLRDAHLSNLAALAAEWEERGYLAPRRKPGAARGAPRKPDSPQRAAWRAQKARRRALAKLL